MRGVFLIFFLVGVIAYKDVLLGGEIDVPKQSEKDNFEPFARYFFEKYSQKLMGPPGMPGLQSDEKFVQDMLHRIYDLEIKVRHLDTKVRHLQEGCISPIGKLYNKLKSIF